MKILYLRFLVASLIVITGNSAFAQNKSAKIEMFIKVWGFLKYHHPAVASGKINWDSVYVNNLPLVEKAISKSQLNELLLSVVNNLGPIQTIQPAVLPDSLFTANHNLDWIDRSTLFTSTLKSKLKEIYKYRNQGKNIFIKPGYDKVAYSGERQYENMSFPNQNYRLLFLARFWNIINYFDPDKYLIGEDWDNALSRFIPKIMNTTDTVTYYKTLLQLAVSLHDGHAQLGLSYDETPINEIVFGKYTAPLFITIVNNTAVVRKPANDSLCTIANIKKRDIILSVNDVPVVKKIAQLKSYVSASNSASANENISRVLLNGPDAFQKLKIKRGRQIFTVKVKCILTSQKNWGDIQNYTANKTGYKTIGNSIAYVYAMQVWKGNMDTVKSLIKSHKAVIFDGRNYQSNGDVFYNLFDIFLPAPKIIDMSTYVMPANPGYFEWKSSAKIGRVNNTVYKGEVVILVDERAQSQGEYTAMAFQTIPNAITIGSSTAGADGVKTYIPMGGKLTLSYSGYGVYYPDKRLTQRIGVKIDIQAKKTIESVIKDEDVALDAALKYLKEKGID
jgi:carboxyl-terminal processing protease